MHVDILSLEGRVLYLEQMLTFVDPANNRGAAQDLMRLVRVRQTSTGTDIAILLTRTPIAPVRRCCHANSYVRNREHTNVFSSSFLLCFVCIFSLSGR